ncbi:hypothetical protein GN316_01675 [Xylophilus sp. Kf1]|nr:hypothetical protein [Xylophilus sp. Kf1]
MADQTWKDTYLRMRAADPDRDLYTPTDSVIEESRFVDTAVPGADHGMGSGAGADLRRARRVRVAFLVAVVFLVAVGLWLAIGLFAA